MTFCTILGMGQPTHVLVDTLQHPAVLSAEHAEGAAIDSSDVSDTSSASSSSSNSLDLVSDYLTDDWMIIVTGIIGGCVGCVLILAIVSVTMRRCYKSRNSRRTHKHNRARDSNGLNNSDSSSEKGCYSDPTITSDNMILMANGEMESDDIVRSASYIQDPNLSHLNHQHLHQCLQQPNQSSFDHHNQVVSGFQHINVGSTTTMRKGILKHNQSSASSGTILSGKNDSLCIQQPKPDVTIAGNGDGQGSPMPSLPPKNKHNMVATIAPNINSQGCQEHAAEFGKS